MNYLTEVLTWLVVGGVAGLALGEAIRRGIRKTTSPRNRR